MKFEQIQNLEECHFAKVFRRFPVALDHGHGATLADADGKEYVDFGAGIAVNIFGACDEEWREAVESQLSKIQHVSNLYYSEPQVKLAEILCEKTGARRVFFSNSGAEANECAFKAARKYSFKKYGEGRYKIISLKESFHGRTLFTLTATGQDAFHRYFDPFVPGMESAEADMASIRRAADQTTCAIVIECIQGESGVRVLDCGFVKELERFAKERDILLIVDEVQTGNGRTGTLYAYEQFGIEPDIVTTAKGLGGGLPIGATLFFRKSEYAFEAGDHGSTFGGNPVCCAGAYNVMSRLTEEFLLEVRAKGEYMSVKLGELDGVEEVTGMGLMIGLKTNKPAREVADGCLKKGLLVLTAHDRVRIVPPLTITKTEMDEGIAILREVLKK